MSKEFDYSKLRHVTSVDQSDRKVPYNLRQSGPTKVEMLISTRVRKSPYWHLSMKDEKQLKDYVLRCKDGGVKQVLVIGGGREPMGKFDSSFQLLETGYFEKMIIGIAGHPEGSPDISDSDLEKAMIDKKPYADYIVTQWLLDAQPIVDFISKQTIPVHVGITGPMKISSVIKFANIVGAKNSINFLKSNFTKH